MFMENWKIGKFNALQRGAIAAGLACAALPGGWALAGAVTPPSSVPSTFTASQTVNVNNANLGLAATIYQITTSGNGNLNPGYSSLEQNGGYPTLQGMANLETLAGNGSYSFANSSTGRTDAYTATKYGTFTNTYINTQSSGVQAIGIGGGGSPISSVVALINNANSNLPSSATTDTWNNVILDQTGYVYATAGQQFLFQLPGSDSNDDGTEILIGGTGAIGSGTVIAAQNADQSLSSASYSTTVTFQNTGYYRFELFNAQTWGGAGLNLAITPAGPTQGSLTFYNGGTIPAGNAAPTPTPLWVGWRGLDWLGRIGPAEENAPGIIASTRLCQCWRMTVTDSEFAYCDYQIIM